MLFETLFVGGTAILNDNFTKTEYFKKICRSLSTLRNPEECMKSNA